MQRFHPTRAENAACLLLKSTIVGSGSIHLKHVHWWIPSGKLVGWETFCVSCSISENHKFILSVKINWKPCWIMPKCLWYGGQLCRTRKHCSNFFLPSRRDTMITRIQIYYIFIFSTAYMRAFVLNTFSGQRLSCIEQTFIISFTKLEF